MKNITVLGATGSVGTQTLKIVNLYPAKFKIFALSANNSVNKMAKLCNKYQPKIAVMVDKKSASELRNKISTNTEILAGIDNLNFIASHAETDIVICAIVGSIGVHSTLAAVSSAKRVLIANKESLVLAGGIIMRKAKKVSATIIPIDSEHNAIFQIISKANSGINHIELTASGGPFLYKKNSELINVTPKQACQHPNWSMGAKISIDSATMLNKGLEVIEAHYLFNLNAPEIKVIIHPQSIVHSSVYFIDGSVISQLGLPDMRTAISYGLNYPQRLFSGVDNINLTKHTLEFHKVDFDKFIGLKLAYFALRSSEAHMGALNAANEVAVNAFLQGKIKFLDITKIIEKTLEKTKNMNFSTLEDVLANDRQSRIIAKEFI